MTAGRAAALAVLLAATAACGDDAHDPSAGMATTVTREGGVARVVNQGSPPAWHAVETFRIGEVEGEGPAVFGQIRSVAADAVGSVYAADAQAREIRVFDRDGMYLRTIGRGGSGPGEFRNLMGVAFLGDTLAALDPGNARIQLFTLAGEALDAREATGATGPPSVFQPRRVAGREFWARDIRRRPEGGLETVFVRHTVAGAGDTLAAPDAPEGAGTGVLCRGENFITSFRFASAPELLHDIVAGGHRVTMWTDTHRFALLDAAGDTLRTVSWSRSPVALDDAAWEEETADFREFRRSTPSARCEPSSPPRPPHRSAARHLMSDDRGRIWIESVAGDGWVWDVFDGEGRWIAELATPERSAGVPPYVRDGHLYQVETDDLDVQYLAGYRITENR